MFALLAGSACALHGAGNIRFAHGECLCFALREECSLRLRGMLVLRTARGIFASLMGNAHFIRGEGCMVFIGCDLSHYGTGFS